tara:strand:+ start:428 stop:619 length:192 start_codon:yes stop_codon:yes gene_type:complete
LSRFAKPKQEVISKQEPEIKLNVKDTDFLLKVLGRSTFSGEEVELAYIVIQKIGQLHRSNLDG